MSLDLDIFLQDNNLKDKFSFSKQSLLEDIETNKHNVSLYYGLNWAGVKYSYIYAMNKFVVENQDKFQSIDINDIDDNKSYMIAYKDFKDQEEWDLEAIAKNHTEILEKTELNEYFRFCFEKGSFIKDTDKNILSLPKIKIFDTAIIAQKIEEDNIELSGAISLLALNYWCGGNNECIRYTYDNKYKTNLIFSKGKIKKVKHEKILFVNELVNDKNVRKPSLLNNKNNFKEFMRRIDNALEILKNDNSYIGIKEHQLLEILKYFYTHEGSELYVNFG